MAATAVLVTAVALLAAVVCPAAAFVQLMGNSDVYCDAEGSYCRGDSDCCAGLECAPRFSRNGGGVCKRRERPPQEAESAPADQALPSRYLQVASGGGQSCQSDADCSPGQCCVRRSAGPRGAGASACSADCSDREASSVLADFYSRYYRRSLRDGKQQRPHHGRAHKQQRHREETSGDTDGKKKKKKQHL